MRNALPGVVVITVLLALYLAVAGYRAVMLLVSGDPVGVTMGAALLILPLIGMWALVREIRFGVLSAQLMKRLESEGKLPEDAVETMPSGRVVRASADALFPKYQAEAEANPLSWQSWLRLGLVYDACGDRRRARGAVNQAIKLSRA
jgi:hypothetical protein